ncbi:putative sugar transferase EpsL [Brevibacillus agri]|uniref:Sugar transferase n=1 Tax=Brevibacillus agri TaxID=51101 RepID=A0A3M8BAG4_9BACL|nr:MULTISPECIES: sugar transferase [Brevibacillus]ELK43107.1 polysaccharide biosynthesis protein [Brevibacillus agri BAB-2500]EJL43172.1 glycosyl transferase possibly involved in lipopolysaccharide synthesis [Brevibacillus sp. CF112]MBG9566029.1 sugar transferase [Brevibacillus agri]MBY0052500.1 sugar transferase [Brevibacillus agri]MDN4092039.1 sugar transferase [Brevibacillus agri]
MKCLFDRLVALTLLLVFSPLLLLLSILIRFKLGAPVLFVQERPGRYGKPFSIYKFRTMTNQCDASGQLLPDAQRLTPFGMMLRKYSLDELPQLWNVLRGELSLVGPRPLLMEYLPLYTPRQMKRHEVLPGITGWAQVNGRNAITWEQKFELDVWYVENRSFWLDLKILLLTVKRVLQKTGISHEGCVTMEKFTGSKQAELARREMREFDRAYESG